MDTNRDNTQVPSSPLAPLSPESGASSSPPPAPLLPLPPSPDQKLSSVVFVVISIEEKPVGELPAGVDNSKDWVELPAVDGDSIIGSLAYGDVYAGETKAYIWVFQEAEDHAYLANHWNDSMEACLLSGRALQREARDSWLRRWRECMTNVRRKVRSTSIIGNISDHLTAKAEEPYMQMAQSPPNLAEPPIEDPLPMMWDLLKRGSCRMAAARRAQKTNGAASYAFDGVVPDSVAEAIAMGLSLKRALDNGSVSQAHIATKRRHLDLVQTRKQLQSDGSEYVGSTSCQERGREPPA
ncbi:hypothetical protein B0H21DRAFT_736473 [Amylocystis lapponica]|nr:hypothetical protein B0H21DRAFT_736473 [Amylocystis lapponica]